MRNASSSVNWQNSPSLAVTGGSPSTSRVISAQTCLCCGSGPILGTSFPQHLIEDVVGGSHEGLDAVDRPDARHLLLVRLLPLGPAVVGSGPVRLRAPHRHPLAVGGDDQQRPFLLGGRRFRSPSRNGVAEPATTRFMCSSVREPSRRPSKHLQRAARLGERLLEAEPLAPVLQDVGEVALGQPQALVQRDPLDLLPLPGAVDDPRDGQLAEDRDVAAVVRFGQPPEGPALGRSTVGPRSPSPWSAMKTVRRVVPEAEQAPHQVPLHRVDPLAVVGGLADEVPGVARTARWALRAACSGVMIMASSPGCSPIGV